MKYFNNKNILIDIDGTIKDLVKENTVALEITLREMNNINCKIRGKLVLAINKINMYLVKTGLLPTNKFMQYTLLFIYSIILFKSYNKFVKIYFDKYDKQNIFFGKNILYELYEKENDIYLITKNSQNSTIYGSNDNCINDEKLKDLIIAEKCKSKCFTYKKVMERKKIEKGKALIIGDNLWDDVIPAIFLKVDVVWCDMYNCKLKKLVKKILTFFCKYIVA